MVVTTRRTKLDRIASVTRNLRLDREVIVGTDVVSREGYVVAVRLLHDKATYNQLEDVHGRLVPLRGGDVVAGVLGSRRALRGYAGEVPERLEVGERLHVLNLGGVLGRCTSIHPDLGPPFEAELLGAVLRFPDAADRIGTPAHIGAGAIPPADRIDLAAPLVVISGTSMDSGKTVAGTEIVRGLSRAGLRVAAVKLTGVSLRRDVLSMMDAGAVEGLSFTDAGVVSTRDDEVVPTALGLLNRAGRVSPDVVVAELGDGLFGDYGVSTILSCSAIMERSAALVLCATDPVGAWGGVRALSERWGLTPTVVSGAVTDNDVGRRFVGETLHLPARNARQDGPGLSAVVLEALRVSA